MDDVFRALADSSRRRLLDRLNQRNGQTLRELCDGLAMTRQSVSKHLALLEAANLITTQRRGREKLHYLNPVPINAIAERWMTQYDRARASALADLKHALEFRQTEGTSMSTDATSFVYTTYINATPEQTWQGLTEPAFTRQYWGLALRSDWQVGSTITWELENITIADDSQVVLVSDPPRKLSFTWHKISDDFIAAYGHDKEFIDKAVKEKRSKVTFEIEPVGSAVKLTVTHDDFEPGSVVLEGVSGGWPSLIAGLKTLLETGKRLDLG
jgi:DNA-binding transcriptional ArsR family regulator/uncharacterized protein YndB with AHSA1/START domain